MVLHRLQVPDDAQPLLMIVIDYGKIWIAYIHPSYNNKRWLHINILNIYRLVCTFYSTGSLCRNKNVACSYLIF